MSIQEKKDEIVSVLDDLPENTLDHILKMLEEEGRPLIKVSESTIKGLEGKGIKLPIGRKDGKKIRRTPIKASGKPLSEMIIEDRR